jgi:3'(2'), 5'-bisphosphate nucleotidase
VNQQIELTKLLETARLAAEKASSEVLQIYNSKDFLIESKSDKSPLTIADKRSHASIMQTLADTGLPVLSEEGRDIPYQERRTWDYFWMVDPLDGTKEFINRNGEFTVNIALIERGVPILGVVAVPVTGEVYFSAQGLGAQVSSNGTTRKLSDRKPIDLKASGLRVVASRSHMNSETEAFINSLTNASLVSAGSSLKFLLIARGDADVYPRYGPTMEWDTAAAHAIVDEVGLGVYHVRQSTNDELTYNKENLLNPNFIVR